MPWAKILAVVDERAALIMHCWRLHSDRGQVDGFRRCGLQG